VLDLRGLFESRDHSLVQLLENPPKVRLGGFDLRSGRNSQIVGRLRRSVTEEYKLLEVHRDGVVVFAAPGDRDRLCWARKERQNDHFLINQLALVEMTYLFCLLVQILCGDKLASGEQVELQLQICRLGKGNNNFLLETGTLNDWSMDVRQAPADSVLVRSEVRYGIDSPERWAVIILFELYAWFGYEEDQIPYTIVTEEGRVVDPSQISTA
jgi:hypothetical protein